MTTVTSSAARARAGATPGFAQLCQTLYGSAIDSDQVWDDVMKLAPDQADVNAHQGPSKTKRVLEGTALASTVAGGILGIKEGGHAIRAIRTGRTAGMKIPRKAWGSLGLAGAATGGDAITTGVLASQNKDVDKMLRPTGRALSREVVKAWPKLDAVTGGIRATTKQVTAAMVPKAAANPAPAAASIAARQAKVAGRAAPNYPAAAKSPAAAAAAKAPAAAVPAAGPSAGTQLRQTRRAANAAGRPATPGDAANRAVGQNRAQAAGKDIGTALNTRTGQAVAGGTALATGAGLYQAGSNAKANAAYMPDVYSKGDDVIFKGVFSEIDEDQHTAFGWASVTELNGSPVVDRQGDFITTEDIEKAAYSYVHKSRVGGDMHRRGTSLAGDAAVKVSDLIESIVFTDEKVEKMGLPADYPRGWWVGFKIHDEPTWQLVKKGLRTGFSIHGKGMRKMISMDEAMGYR